MGLNQQFLYATTEGFNLISVAKKMKKTIVVLFIEPNVKSQNNSLPHEHVSSFTIKNIDQV